MADRYQSLYRLQPNLYLEGCPVVIVAGALLKDTVTDKVLAQLKIRNLEEKNLIACKVAVRAFDSNGTELDGVSEFPYMDISAALGQDFGAKVPVYLPDSDTRRIEVSVTELIFEDDSVWKEEPCEWKELPKCFLQVLFGKSCKQKWRKLNLQNGESCRHSQLTVTKGCGNWIPSRPALRLSRGLRVVSSPVPDFGIPRSS